MWKATGLAAVFVSMRTCSHTRTEVMEFDGPFVLYKLPKVVIIEISPNALIHTVNVK